MTLQNPTLETPDTGTPGPPPGVPPDPAPDLQAELRKARTALAQSETRRHAQRLLLEARTIDLDAATLLVEAALGPATHNDAESAPDATVIAKAVEDLRRKKPILFRASSGSAMSPHVQKSGIAGDLLHHAAATGDRNALLRYLRARRTTG